MRILCSLAFTILLAAPVASFAAEPEWTPLFQKDSLAGWTATPGGEWTIKNGVVTGRSPKAEKRHGILLSDKTFDNFHVQVQFRVTEGNSGFYFRSEKIKGAFGVHGFQAEVDTTQLTGGLYETGGRAWVTKPDEQAIQQRNYQPGEWTTLDVIADDGHVVVKINGVVSSELTDDPGRKSGHFGLQLHGGQDMHVEFRDLKIKELE